MRICCVADLHGYLPEIPRCDLLLIAGDICPQWKYHAGIWRWWLNNDFRRWLEGVGSPIIGVAGNHDWIFERAPELVPGDLPWTYLQDSGCEIGGLKVWGSPHQPIFHSWAFNLDEPELCERWALIPSNTDVLLLHGPPLGYGDLAPRGVHTGSPGLLDRIVEIAPRLVVAGHIHAGYGRYKIGPTAFVNAAHLDERYRPTNPPIVVDL